MNYDRLIFGTGCVFLVKVPGGEIRRVNKDGKDMHSNKVGAVGVGENNIL